MKLIKEGFNQDNILSYGNMFLIGNGHIGYRGTLEEYKKDQMVGLNVVGLYDKFQDKWRESINMPNPFNVEVKSDNKSFFVFNNNLISHKFILDIDKGIFYRNTEFDSISIKSERFIPFIKQNVIFFKYKITAKEDINLNIKLGIDLDIYEINGPHFVSKEINNFKSKLSFVGKTNENKLVYENNNYIFSGKYGYLDGYYYVNKNLCKGESFTIYCFSQIREKEDEEILTFSKSSYNLYKNNHINDFKNKWDSARVEIIGNKKANFALNYSIYQLLILGSEYYNTSIPARGLSGQTYKGAIFWDTEIFMVPFFCLTNPKIAKRLIEYRKNTLDGAILKAKELGYEGAFYAWESQENGIEACSKYNVTDPITNMPIRTYFDSKQIHISSDIIYALNNYLDVTEDYEIVDEKCLRMVKEVIKFFMSYAVNIDGIYHINDVIGPDEYHERIDDNAFTSYMVSYVCKVAIDLFNKFQYELKFVDEIKQFLNKLYLPPIGKDGIIEQFKGYNKLEEVSVDVVRSRLRHPKDYWGGANGVATPTKVIKQADVITLLVLLNEMFDNKTNKANFDYYYPFTEHGSSLSSSMYSIVASKIGYEKLAYEMFMKSAEIDLGTNQKMFAGGIYIGGTHPASNAGAYLSVIFGMAGLTFDNNRVLINPHLPKGIKGLKFKIVYRNKKYLIIINKDKKYVIKEI